MVGRGGTKTQQEQLVGTRTRVVGTAVDVYTIQHTADGASRTPARRPTSVKRFSEDVFKLGKQRGRTNERETSFRSDGHTIH